MSGEQSENKFRTATKQPVVKAATTQDPTVLATQFMVRCGSLRQKHGTETKL